MQGQIRFRGLFQHKQEKSAPIRVIHFPPNSSYKRQTINYKPFLSLSLQPSANYEYRIQPERGHHETIPKRHAAETGKDI